MKRTFSVRESALVVAGVALIAATYGLVRLAYGLYLPDVQAELGFDAAAAGGVSAGASVMYCVGAAAGFALAAGRARALTVAAAACAGIGAAGMALAPGFAVFAGFAVLASAGAGLASPALVDIVRRSIAPEGLPAAQSTVNAGTGPGLALAGLLALTLLPQWRAAWLVSAAITLAAAVAVLVLDPRRGREDAVARGRPSPAWYRAHRGVLAAALLMGAGTAAFWTFGGLVLAEGAASDIGATLGWIAIGAGGTAVIVTAGPMSALSPRGAWAVTIGAAAAATLALPAASTGLPGALAACALFGWGYTAGSGALIAWTTRIDAAGAPTGTALLFIVLVIGQAVGAAALGFVVANAGHAPAFAAAAGLCASAILIASVTGVRAAEPRGSAAEQP